MQRTLVLSFTGTARSAKVYRDREWEQYVVRISNFGILNPAADYFADDLQDARETALAECFPATSGRFAQLRAAGMEDSKIEWLYDDTDPGAELTTYARQFFAAMEV